jgi:hypothetical protein
MTLEDLQRLYFRWQWANGTALYAAKRGTPEERRAAENAALDRYEAYLRGRAAYEQRKEMMAG